MSSSRERRFRKKCDAALKKAGDLVGLANVYAEDGALFTAAKRLHEAAEEMEKAGHIRNEWLSGQ